MKISPFRGSSQHMRTHDETINTETRFCDNHRNVKVKEERSRKMQKKIDGIFAVHHDTTRICGGQGHWYTSRLASPRRSYTESPHAKHAISWCPRRSFTSAFLSRRMRATETSRRREVKKKKKRYRRESRTSANSRDVSQADSFGLSYQVPRRGRYYSIVIFDIPSAWPKCLRRLPRSSRRRLNIANLFLF